MVISMLVDSGDGDENYDTDNDNPTMRATLVVFVNETDMFILQWFNFLEINFCRLQHLEYLETLN